MKSTNFFKIGLRTLQLAIALSVTVGCAADLPQKTRNLQAKNADALSTDAFLPQTKARIGIELLDTESLAITGLGVGLGESLGGNVPVVSYLLPRLADYSQILKCDSQVNLGDLRTRDLSYSNSSLLGEVFLKTDYWQLALENPLCKYLTEGFSLQGQVSFADAFSESGSFVYLARACVAKERIEGVNSDKPKECSRWVSISKAIEGYVNNFNRNKAEKSDQIRRVRDKGDAIARRLHYLAVRIGEQLTECDANWAKNQEKKALRESLFDFLGKGVEFGVATFGPKGVSVDGGGLSGALKNIFASPNDYPSTCAAALASRLEGEALRVEFDALAAQYSALFQGVSLPSPLAEKPSNVPNQESK